MRPMLASTGDRSRVPSGPGWSHEVKWDGIRILAESTDAGPVRLFSRNEREVTVAWPDVARRSDTPRDLLVDGEVIGLDTVGRPSFPVLQDRMHVRTTGSAVQWAERVPATFMVFDLLRLDGVWLGDQPLLERRARLTDLDLAGSGWQVPATFEDGEMLLQATSAQGLEGIVSKRLDSRYEPGVRSRAWLKFAHRPSGSYVVGGWRPQVGSTNRLAALLVGEVTSAGLLYRGRVGSGIGPSASRLLTERLAGTERVSSPFVDEVPTVDARGATWTEPLLVVEVESLGLARRRLRQAAYQGVRTDLSPADLGSA